MRRILFASLIATLAAVALTLGPPARTSAAPPLTEDDAAKLRKLQHEGDLKELELRREMGEVVEVKEVKEYALGLFKRLHNRVALRFPSTLASAGVLAAFLDFFFADFSAMSSTIGTAGARRVDTVMRSALYPALTSKNIAPRLTA